MIAVTVAMVSAMIAVMVAPAVDLPRGNDDATGEIDDHHRKQHQFEQCRDLHKNSHAVASGGNPFTSMIPLPEFPVHGDSCYRNQVKGKGTGSVTGKGAGPLLVTGPPTGR